jgi:acyl-CoA synthetase (AMP-forming)/AMP-acid ligase II
MSSHWLIERLRGWGERPALVWQGDLWSYARLCEAVDDWRDRLKAQGVEPAGTLALCGDYSPQLCALLLAALDNRNILVPLSSTTAGRRDRLLTIAEVRHVIEFDGADRWQLHDQGRVPSHPLLRSLVEAAVPGLILFSSGSTGESKASVLDLERLLAKFRDPAQEPRSYRTLVFLLLDHIGGINTLFHVLANGGTLVTTRERSPDAVCAAIERHRIELLPTTPTFLKMLLISEAAKRHDLSSLKVVTYGTEPMPASTLAALRDALPDVRLKQTYGLSELGILPTRSRSSDSLWLKLGTNGFEHKILNGVLWIRSKAAMLGYLNAPSPFDADGWFNTQDLVEVDGDYVRILGRKSELINVGGEKVHPTEIESVLLGIDNVRDATVSGRPNPITGAVVVARITPVRPEDPESLRRRVRQCCRERLERYKIPAVIEVVQEDHHSERFKKARSRMAADEPTS